ncbi:uncharacterized protein LOC111623574 [Centruroides sculpturatus]|uniref:uncharacterized protein LOC111623574 n=1 Tax=Centruroides sculpturatus TaxID=218467 RepID=UPI000C6DB4B1|nr:uncharacterized protein LOC111623574 [Centruroides sculpturatus]
MIYIILVSLIFASSSLIQASKLDLQDCYTTAHNFSLSNVNIKGLPVKAGSNITLEFDALSLMKVEEGTKIEVSISYYFLTYSCYNNKLLCFDICKLASQGAIICLVDGHPCKCPFHPGYYKIRNFVAKMPASPIWFTSIKVTVRIKAYDPSGKLIGCIKAKNVPVIY